jgi:hypothetical protein
VVHAVGAAAEFAGSLRAAEEQDAEDGDFAAVEVEDFLEAMFVFGDAAIGSTGGTGEAFFLERVQGFADGLLVEVGDRFTIVFLIAGID